MSLMEALDALGRHAMAQFTPEQRHKVNSYVAHSLWYVAGAFLFLFTSGALVFQDIIHLSGPTTPEDLGDFGARLQFLCRYLVVHSAWIIFAILNVMWKRYSPAIDPLGGHESLTQAANNVLQNSIEHSMILVVSQLTFLAAAEPVDVARWIPFFNVMHAFGRVTFWLGYPEKRAFGFLISFVPIIPANGFALYRLVQFMAQKPPGVEFTNLKNFINKDLLGVPDH